jgi:S-DNA-T family DNA segregation ATPase FtsK/SpoIIIE
MFLESTYQSTKELFISSFQTQIDLVNRKIAELENNILEKSNEQNSGLNSMDEQVKINLDILVKKCEYLKAEIWRYKKLLETFSKTETGPEMNQRILDLETAIKEHSELKIKEFSSLSAKQRSDFQLNYTRLINDLNIKLEITKDDFVQKTEALISGFQEYLNININSNKGTADLERLISFPVADYNNTSSSVKLGNVIYSLGNAVGSWDIQIPLIVDFYDKSNFILFYDDSCKTNVENITDGLILRTLTSNLPDKIQLKIFDSQFWDKFSEFLKLPASVISKGSNSDDIESAISSVEKEVREKLTLIWSDVQESNQTTHEFNSKKIKSEKYDEIIPYRLFVLDNCQNLLDQSKLFDLLERSSHLTRFGCNFILMFNIGKAVDKEYSDKLKSIQFDTYKIIDLTGQFVTSEFSEDTFQTTNLDVDDKKILLETFQSELNEVIANRAKLRFVENCEKDKTLWFSGSVGHQIKMPIGKSKSTEGLEYLSFNTKDGLSNALLCGGVGSGKTNLLKSIITSAAMTYSPEQMEMYLIDLKNGAGFSIFEAQRLPHVKLFAFSAENELINDVFENLRLEMDRRYEQYSKFNIDNLADVYKDDRLAATAPKRTLVVIDEFGSLSATGDDFLDIIFMNILAIVQRGRAMGINLLLATQNFSNIKHSSFWQAVTQIPTRIILKSSPEAAQSILAMSNTSSKEITRIGEGFINFNYGEINADGGNQFFKSYLLDNDDLLPLLEEIRTEADLRKFNLKPSIFLDSSKEAIFSSNENLLHGHSADEVQFKKNGISCWIGESFLMGGSTHFHFDWKINNKSYDQNILISGNEREYSLQALFSLASSISYGVPDSNVSIKWIIPFDEDLKKDLGLDILANLIPDNEIFSEKELETVLRSLNNIRIERTESEQNKFPIIVFMPGLEKFVALHKNSGTEDLLSIFLGLLNSGSSQGIYFVCEINKATSISKLGFDVIGSFEHRIAYSMNKEDSIEIINSDKASKLIDPENLSCRSKAIYYSQSSQEAIKFKSYINLQTEKSLINSQFSPGEKISLENYHIKESPSISTKQSNSYMGIDINEIPEDATISLEELMNGMGEDTTDK